MKYCSFCGKSEKDSSLIFVGNNSYICSECIELGHKYIEENKQEVFSNLITDIPKPKDIKKFLDDYVIGQDAAKERIAVAVYNHYKRISSQNIADDVEIEKSNICMVGPTGTGKCISGDTFVNIRNKKTGEIEYITVNDLINKLNLK